MYMGTRYDMADSFIEILESGVIEASAPCRIDLGGTLDISTFYHPLRHLSPSTFNIAIDLRTRVKLLPLKKNAVKISSRGFESAEYPVDKAPFNHPLGLMFAVAAYFRAENVHIIIDSSSPPCSALGGSSSAAVALVAAFSAAFEKTGGDSIAKDETAILAHSLEESVAGVPCGLQDQLAAAYGGINAWHWQREFKEPLFSKETILPASEHESLKNHILLVYCGMPHESKNINSKWVKGFLSGTNRDAWAEIIECANKFIRLFKNRNFKKAAEVMNRETAIRVRMTPDVLDDMGKSLVDAAMENGCGARFTGAGGGGCVWALGEADEINRLGSIWREILTTRKDACLLDFGIDSTGLQTNG
jgi:D-glycero-alpha-D-manno-heptose-7-phosphate kinase